MKYKKSKLNSGQHITFPKANCFYILNAHILYSGCILGGFLGVEKRFI